MTDALELANALLGDFPALICIVDETSKKVAYANKTALETLGDDIVGKSVDSINNGNTLVLTAGEKSGNAYEYESCVNGDWHWVTHYRCQAGDAPLQLFAGVTHGKLKRIESLEQEAACAISKLQKQIADFKSGSAIPFSVCHVDIDGMAAVNEALGSEAGDKCIETVAQVIQGAVRQTDIFSKMEQDEFLLIFPKCSYSIVDTIMGTIVSRLDVLNAEENLDYSISYGIIEVDKVELADVDTIMSSLKKLTAEMKGEKKKLKR
jgi:diguanylate cyclase (GGDEF)-like protein